MKGIDCSTPLTAATASKLSAAGYTFAARYLVPAGYSKRLTRAEAEAISNAGLQIVSVFETTDKRPQGGAKNGYIDGAAAYREALAIGQPKGTAIYFACDWEVVPEEYKSVEEYLNAAQSQIPGYEVGVYGSYSVIEEMAKRGAAKHFWQTYAWSAGKRSLKTNLYQHQNGVKVAGITLDLNESYGGEGWWNTKEVKLKVSVEDANKIILIMKAAWGAASTDAEKKEIHRLTDEVRKAAGMPTT